MKSSKAVAFAAAFLLREFAGPALRGARMGL
jgi:hypothetical protein